VTIDVHACSLVVSRFKILIIARGGTSSTYVGNVVYLKRHIACSRLVYGLWFRFVSQKNLITLQPTIKSQTQRPLDLWIHSPHVAISHSTNIPSIPDHQIKKEKKRKEDPSIPKTHAPLSAPPFAPLVRRRPPSLAALRRSSSSSRPTTADSLANAASRRLQSPIFANFGCSTAGRRRGRRGPASRGAASVGWGLAVESRQGRRCSSTGAGTSMVAPGHPRSPAAYKVAAARELPHPAVRCYAGVFAGAPDGREAVDSVARPRPAGGRPQPPSPSAAVQQDLADIKVSLCSRSNRFHACYPITYYNAIKLTDRESPAGKPCFVHHLPDDGDKSHCCSCRWSRRPAARPQYAEESVGDVFRPRYDNPLFWAPVSISSTCSICSGACLWWWMMTTRF
jgi:hypothetical protein